MLPKSTALLIVDLQNDFVHADGAYGRAGLSVPAIAALPQRVKPVADALRSAGGWIVSTQFTLVPGKGGETVKRGHEREQILRTAYHEALHQYAHDAWGTVRLRCDGAASL